MSEGECLFAHETCLTHPLHRVALCTEAADALRAKVTEAEAVVREAKDEVYQAATVACDERLRRGAAERDLATRAAQVGAMREALEVIARRVPIMTSTGDYRVGQEHALEGCRTVAVAALASGEREEEKPVGE